MVVWIKLTRRRRFKDVLRLRQRRWWGIVPRQYHTRSLSLRVCFIFCSSFNCVLVFVRILVLIKNKLCLHMWVLLLSTLPSQAPYQSIGYTLQCCLVILASQFY